MNALERIRELVPPPSTPIAAGSDEGFEKIERRLGITLPSDYKTLITTYGDGTWQGFWSILNPFSANKHLNLLEQASAEGSSGMNILSAERYIRDRHDYPHAIWPEPGGIFPWAVTDNGGRFFWRTGGSPERWSSVYYPSRDPDYEEIHLSSSEILAGILTGDASLFAEEFGGELPPATFECLASNGG